MKHSEILEGLEIFKQQLLQFKANIREQIEDIELLNSILKKTNSLKNSLAMVSKNDSSKLIHSLESCFDQVRNGKIAGDEALTDIGISVIDCIKIDLNNELTDPDRFITLTDHITHYQTLESKKDQKRNVSVQLSTEQKNILSNSIKKGHNIFQVEKLLVSKIDKDSYLSLPIFDDIKELGTLITFTPEFEDIPKTRNEFILKILFTTASNEEDLSFIILDPLKKIDTEKYILDKKKPSERKEQGQDKKQIPTTELRALIVDDNMVNRFFLKKVFEKIGYADMVTNGVEAVEIFKLSLETSNHYDIIFLDIMMPEMDGHEALKKIRELENQSELNIKKRTKIFMTSALSDSKNVMDSFKEQCDDYIVKPIDIQDLLKKLRKHSLI